MAINRTVRSVFAPNLRTRPVAPRVRGRGMNESEPRVFVVNDALARSARVVESRARLARLTPREFEVLRLMITGLANKEISAELGITLRTVKAHRTGVTRKIGALSVVDLVRLALVAGVAPAQPGIVSRAKYG